jgi:hypothetical protein
MFDTREIHCTLEEWVVSIRIRHTKAVETEEN